MSKDVIFVWVSRVRVKVNIGVRVRFQDEYGHSVPICHHCLIDEYGGPQNSTFGEICGLLPHSSAVQI